MSPTPTSASVAPRSRAGSSSPSQRCSRWAARYVSMRWVTHRHQPSTYSLIHAPKNAGARVMTTRDGQLGDERPVHAGAHHLMPRQAGALA